MNIQIETFKAEIEILTIIALSKMNYVLYDDGLMSYGEYDPEEIKKAELEELIHYFISVHGPESGDNLLPFLKETFTKTEYNVYFKLIRDTDAGLYNGGVCRHSEDPAITADPTYTVEF
jgi:hypothetical protein